MGCMGALPLGALWFYDVTDPANPAMEGSYNLPRDDVTNFSCTAHNFDVIPLTDGRDVLVSAWYTGGTTVVDFTDPANPLEIGHYLPEGGNSWSSYFYNGYIYANNLGSRGVDVLRLDEKFLSARVALPHLNPQSQERLPAANAAGTGKPPSGGSANPAPSKVLGSKTGALAGTGIGSSLWPGLALVVIAAGLAVRIRRV